MQGAVARDGLDARHVLLQFAQLLHAFLLAAADLEPQAKQLFRRLALSLRPELDKFIAAALLDTGPSDADRLLENLVDHNLLTEHAPGRYRMHNLIRTLAQALVSKDPSPDRADARDRLLRYYAHTAQQFGEQGLVTEIPP